MELLFLLLIFVVPIASWLGLAYLLNRLLKRPEHSPNRRGFNIVIALAVSLIIVSGLTVAILVATCSGFQVGH